MTKPQPTIDPSGVPRCTFRVPCSVYREGILRDLCGVDEALQPTSSICKHAVVLMVAEYKRLKAHARELQAAITAIDDLCVPPERAAEDTRQVGCPVGPYTTNYNHAAVVQRVADRLATAQPSKPASDEDMSNEGIIT